MDDATQSISLGRAQTWNRYMYAENSPINLTDPTGQCPTCFDLVLDDVVDLLGGDFLEQGLSAGLAQLGLMLMDRPASAKPNPDGTGESDELPSPIGTGGPKVDSKTLWPPK